ncbi:MAG: GDYXXLXY domain-containing protein [Candidatus Sumerlaeia bacterium]|nr:GDYXXLXY domain-containing protein [Candidatus Sumerlaeia bacterium]
MKRYGMFGLFCCVALLQLAAPASMILTREAALRKGRLWKFRTAPVDPYDAFRGRFVALNVEAARHVEVSKPAEFKRGQKVYVLLEETSEGFARITDVVAKRPVGDAYIEARVGYLTSSNPVNLILPINRYYMNEKAAPQAERAYWEHSRIDRQNAYVTVRVRNGLAVIEGLYIGDKSIEDFVREQQR